MHVAEFTATTLLKDVIAIRIHKLEVKQLFPSIRGDKTRQITPLKDWKAHLTHFRILGTRGAAPKSQVVLRSQRKARLMRSQALNDSKKRQQHLGDDQQELARQQHLKIARLDVAARNYRS